MKKKTEVILLCTATCAIVLRHSSKMDWDSFLDGFSLCAVIVFWLIYIGLLSIGMKDEDLWK